MYESHLLHSYILMYRIKLEKYINEVDEKYL
jgi:hypothetical protein